MGIVSWFRKAFQNSSAPPPGLKLSPEVRDAAIAILGDVLENDTSASSLGRLSVEKLGGPKELFELAIFEEIICNRENREYVNALKSVFVLLPTFVSPEDYETCVRAGALIMESHSLVGPDGEVTDKEELKRLADSIHTDSRHTEILRRCSEETQEYLMKINSFCRNLGIDERSGIPGMPMYDGTESDQIEIAKRRQAEFRSGGRHSDK